MKVSELIKRLEQEDPNADIVSFEVGDDGYYLLWNLSTEIFVGSTDRIKHNIPYDSNASGVAICGVKSLISDSNFGENLEQY